MRVLFDDQVLADWGRTEASEENWSYEDIVDEVAPWGADDRVNLHLGGRIASCSFTTALEHASNSAASNYLHRLVRSLMPRTTGTAKFQSRDTEFGTVTESGMSGAVVRITGTSRVGVTTFVTYHLRGTMVAIAAELPAAS